MTGETIARSARSRVFDSISKQYEDDETPVTREELEKFAAELVDGLLSEVFDRLEDMRLR